MPTSWESTRHLAVWHWDLRLWRFGSQGAPGIGFTCRAKFLTEHTVALFSLHRKGRPKWAEDGHIRKSWNTKRIRKKTDESGHVSRSTETPGSKAIRNESRRRQTCPKMKDELHKVNCRITNTWSLAIGVFQSRTQTTDDSRKCQAKVGANHENMLRYASSGF